MDLKICDLMTSFWLVTRYNNQNLDIFYVYSPYVTSEVTDVFVD